MCAYDVRRHRGLRHVYSDCLQMVSMTVKGLKFFKISWHWVQDVYSSPSGRSLRRISEDGLSCTKMDALFLLRNLGIMTGRGALLEGESSLQVFWEEPRESDRMYSLEIRIADLPPFCRLQHCLSLPHSAFYPTVDLCSTVSYLRLASEGAPHPSKKTIRCSVAGFPFLHCWIL